MALTESAEAVASYEFGQFIIKHTDKALWLIEKTSQWSLPPPANGKDDKTLVMSELTRPLPWVFFLPTLLMIRLFREIISIAALLVGKGPIKPVDMVRYIQNWRRSLRAIKYHGIRNIRVKNQSKVAKSKDAQGGFSAWVEWCYEKIKGLLCYKVVRYSNGKQPKVLRKNSGEPLLVVKKVTSHKKRALSPDDSDDERFDADSALKELASKIDLLPDTDSDDTEYSFKNLSNDLDTSFTSTDADDDEEKNIDETQDPEEQKADSNVPGSSQKAPKSLKIVSESLKESPETSLKNTEAQKKLLETSQNTSENSHKSPKVPKKSPESSKKSPEAPQKLPETSQKSSDVSKKTSETQKSPEASKNSPEAPQKLAETSQKSSEAKKKPTETSSQRSPEASQKLPEASKKSMETSQKSPEISQKKPDTPKDSPKSTEKNQDKGEVHTVDVEIQNKEVLINGEMETVKKTPSKDENINKTFIDEEKKLARPNIPTNLPGPTSDQQVTDKKVSPNQPTKVGKTSPKTVSSNSFTTKPRRSKITYRSYQPMKYKGLPQKANSEIPPAANESANRSAEQSPK